jgi:hypothetical protein
MNFGRLDFVSNVLPDGRVLALGGEKNPQGVFTFTNTGEIYDPAANTWTRIDDYFGAQGPMGTNEGGGPAPTELLPNGKILVGAFWSTQTWILNPTQPAGQNPSQQ